MPPSSEPSSGSLTGPPLWTLTVVVIGVAGILFYFVSQPLASAFDLLLPSALLEEPAAPAEPEPVVAEEPAEPPPPPPRIWTTAELEAGLAELESSIAALVEAGRTELPTYEDLGTAEEANAQRAAARWQRWGVVWRNRVDAERAKLAPRDQCPSHEALAEACLEVHGLLDDLAAVAEAETYDDAGARLDAASQRLTLYLEPPPPEEGADDEAAGDAGGSLDVAETP